MDDQNVDTIPLKLILNEIIHNHRVSVMKWYTVN